MVIFILFYPHALKKSVMILLYTALLIDNLSYVLIFLLALLSLASYFLFFPVLTANNYLKKYKPIT